ncbi:precorrin-6Y C5,15-methyltransferase [Actinoplanes sp. SE50]|uniref:bifunctional cobalt-precorrin-7 (C(5))-methyltransferase/cobalt-precorrin-6B (C(15))-methyltransferase n=1 Tax=unclassified Actinoplanes TaxID=2626549 RepID=UPI00023ED502|nr:MULTISPECIES: bifunctional cobalt-precorrin-7 (C(5))-methyltransferase/cobalt-precorrin-6B (C(15))-methyltransferase [unclassified Actinoplanes]AEV87873.1 precorrin-6Y C5,15-methyltransferase / precorrin-8W decarboxylase [Actinoplanes sp. SE50/110]ATO86277.1 precorrin-6Y C5,15-methyltransferase [Actinoplanes sp. SE50]SLM03692.1 precorrin-6Y C5,15-methyltransferase [Actinoplanes sp. SE50/110]
MRAENPPVVTVVGIGAGGFPDYGGTPSASLAAAEVIFGSPRQLALLPDSVGAERVPWPSPMLPGLPDLFAAHHGRRICVLASGDPMFHGIGATLATLLGPERLRVLPHPSSVSLAAARLGWDLARTDVVSLVTAPVASVGRVLNPGRRLLVLSAGADTPAAVAAYLTARGYPRAQLTVLEQLGGPRERVCTGAAGDWALPPGDPLNVIAVECGDGPPLPVVTGLPDDAYDGDGQLTKREVRAVTLAALAPVPGALLWDVGAGSGSIGIEWLRAHPACAAIAIESSAERVTTITANAARLGVPGLTVVHGRAPDALDGLPRPDTIFIGGGLTRDGVLDSCLAALRPGGRLVANAVTVESEAVVAAAYARLGGALTRLTVQRGSPVGGFTGWRTSMPVTIWAVTR